jgi:hypothetical protein
VKEVFVNEKSVEEVRTELLDLYKNWFREVPPDGDSEFLKQVLSDDWVYINYIGEIRGKAEYLEYIKPVPLNARPENVTDLQVRIFGDLVVVHGRYFAPGVGEDGSTLLFTGVWIYREGAWECLTHHSTILPK